MNFIKDLGAYFKEIFFRGGKVFLSIFGLVNLVFFFWPQIANKITPDTASVRLFGGILFMVSFATANFLLFRNQHNKKGKNDHKKAQFSAIKALKAEIEENLSALNQESNYSHFSSLSDHAWNNSKHILGVFGDQYLNAVIKAYNEVKKVNNAVSQNINSPGGGTHGVVKQVMKDAIKPIQDAKTKLEELKLDEEGSA